MDKQYCKPQIWGGIECTINRVRNEFFDQLDYSGHYQRLSDMEVLAATGIKKLRYPILWEKHQPTPDTVIDWHDTEEKLNAIREKDIVPIAGLVHHGSGPAFTDLIDPQFPYLLANYARKVATQFPWIEYYTPVNEPLTTARFSGLYGLWYPHLMSSRKFVQILLNQLKGIVLSMQEIRKINPAAKLVQTEDLGKSYSTPKLRYQARFENERRWLTYDILTGKFTPEHKLWKHFKDLEIDEAELRFFIDNPCVPDIFGFNHYLTSERYLDEDPNAYPQHTYGGNGRHRYADVEAVRVELEEETGIEVLLREAWDRYQKPMAITEVHLHCHREEQLRWFKHVWQTSKSLVGEGIQIEAVTAWAMLGAYGWDRLLTEPKGSYEPGVFDVRSGHPRPTALAAFIKEIASEDNRTHPVSVQSGWWHRSSRIIYGHVIPQVRMAEDQTTSPVLIIGKNGTLGRAFARVCEQRCIQHRLISRQQCDISDVKQIEILIEQYKPWAIINAAGYVRVDDAENDSEQCYRDNTLGPHKLALACNKSGVQLLTFSSDLVFDGRKQTPYIENDITAPLNVYGKSKAESERLVQSAAPEAIIIRTSAFFGPWDRYNFIYDVRARLQRYETMAVANNLVISPTYVPDLVNACLDLLIDKEEGIWHLANEGAITWADLAYSIANAFDLDTALIQPVTHKELGYAAARPTYSVLGTNKGYLLPTLENALQRYIAEGRKEARQVA
jgi:dTDP-4-dehydrorhamnose reductase